MSISRRNGDFELGDTTDWVLSADPNNTFVDTIDTSILAGSQSIPGIDDSAFVHSGINGLFLGENTKPGSLIQKLPTTPGAQYQISFWATNPLDGNPNELRALWNGVVLLGLTNVTSFPWIRYQYGVSATASQTELRFEFRNDDYAFGLDDVQVELVPSAEVQLQVTPMISGAITITWNSVAGTTYQLQVLDALGVGAWINQGSPVVGTGPTASQSVSPGAAAQSFYRLISSP